MLFKELDHVEDMIDKESKWQAFDNMINALNQCISSMASEGEKVPVQFTPSGMVVESLQINCKPGEAMKIELSAAPAENKSLTSWKSSAKWCDAPTVKYQYSKWARPFKAKDGSNFSLAEWVR